MSTGNSGVLYLWPEVGTFVGTKADKEGWVWFLITQLLPEKQVHP